jgi:DNA primase
LTVNQRLDRDFLENLKNQYDLVGVVRDHIPALKHIGNGEHVARCPFHDETTASFRVNKQRFHCFGCHKHGDIFKWTEWLTGATFPQAVKSLTRGELPRGPGEAVPRREIPNHTPYDSEAVAAILDSNNNAQFHFMHQDLDHVAGPYYALRFANCESWGIGYASGLEPLGGEFNVKAGLMAQKPDGSYYHRLRDRITIPLKSRTGHILGFVGRIIPRPDNGKLPKYVNPPTTWAFEKRRYLFGLDRLDPQLGYAIVVEGPVDCIKMHEAGFKNVVSSMGTAFSKQQADILAHYVNRIFILYDGDLPGLEAAAGIARRMHEIDAQVMTILLTNGLDPDSWLESGAPRRLAHLPILKASNYFTNNVMISGMATEYDREQLDRLIAPLVQDNIAKGWPHYNVVDWVMAAYPQFAQEIKESMLKMLSEVDEVGGKKMMREANIRAFIKAWMKPSREVRKAHEKHNKKR